MFLSKKKKYRNEQKGVVLNPEWVSSMSNNIHTYIHHPRVSQPAPLDKWERDRTLRPTFEF